MFLLYSFLYTISFILISPIFLIKRKKYLAGLRQRFGHIPSLIQDGNPVIWLHCVSVGETNAARPLVDKIFERFPNHRLVVSTTTSTGQKLAQDIFGDRADAIFYFPFDWRFTVRRALRKIEPSIVLIMETELWFNFLREAYKMGAHIAIVNGRLSEKSVKRYFWIHRTMKHVLHYVELALMQDYKSAKRLIQLGIVSNKVKVTGNIKFDQATKADEDGFTKTFRERFAITGKAPLIVAASTHNPEEKIVLEALKEIWKDSKGQLPRLVIAPRHPERFGEVEKLIRETGFDWVRRTEEASTRDKIVEIILLDSIGELREVYPLADVVFVGGSLIPHGGQSILEPAAYGKAIATGFYTRNFEEIIKTFVEKKALIQLPKLNEKDAVRELAGVFRNLIGNNDERKKLASNALNLMKSSRGATDKTLENLLPYLELKKKKAVTRDIIV